MNASQLTQDSITVGTRIQITSGVNAGHLATAHTFYAGSWTLRMDVRNAYYNNMVQLATNDTYEIV